MSAPRGEIRVGAAYQCKLPAFEGPAPVESDKSETKIETPSYEELVWTNQLDDDDLLMYLRSARSVAAFLAMVDGGSPESGSVAASRDDTSITALDTLHKCNYNVGSALEDLLHTKSGKKWFEKKWSDEDANCFERGFRKWRKDFFRIRRELLPNKKMPEIIEFYYLWKKTPSGLSIRRRGGRRYPKNRRISRTTSRPSPGVSEVCETSSNPSDEDNSQSKSDTTGDESAEDDKSIADDDSDFPEPKSRKLAGDKDAVENSDCNSEGKNGAALTRAALRRRKRNASATPDNEAKDADGSSGSGSNNNGSNDTPSDQDASTPNRRTPRRSNARGGRSSRGMGGSKQPPDSPESDKNNDEDDKASCSPQPKRRKHSRKGTKDVANDENENEEIKNETKQEVKSEPKPEPVAEVKAEPKPVEVKPEVKPKQRTPPKVEVQPVKTKEEEVKVTIKREEEVMPIVKPFTALPAPPPRDLSPEPKPDHSQIKKFANGLLIRVWNRGENNSCARTDLTFKTNPDSVYAKWKKRQSEAALSASSTNPSNAPVTNSIQPVQKPSQITPSKATLLAPQLPNKHLPPPSIQSRNEPNRGLTPIKPEPKMASFQSDDKRPSSTKPTLLLNQGRPDSTKPIIPRTPSRASAQPNLPPVSLPMSHPLPIVSSHAQQGGMPPMNPFAERMRQEMEQLANSGNPFFPGLIPNGFPGGHPPGGGIDPRLMEMQRQMQVASAMGIPGMGAPPFNINPSNMQQSMAQEQMNREMLERMHNMQQELIRASIMNGGGNPQLPVSLPVSMASLPGMPPNGMAGMDPNTFALYQQMMSSANRPPGLTNGMNMNQQPNAFTDAFRTPGANQFMPRPGFDPSADPMLTAQLMMAAGITPGNMPRPGFPF